MKSNKGQTYVAGILFLLALFLLSNSPYFWANTSLTTSVTPKNVDRGDHVFFSGSLGGDDISGKTVTLVVSEPNGDIHTTLSTTTSPAGFYNYTWHIADDCDVGKHSVTVTSELLSATDNFIVKLGAPQKYGNKCQLSSISI